MLPAYWSEDSWLNRIARRCPVLPDPEEHLAIYVMQGFWWRSVAGRQYDVLPVAYREPLVVLPSGKVACFTRGD